MLLNFKNRKKKFIESENHVFELVDILIINYYTWKKIWIEKIKTKSYKILALDMYKNTNNQSHRILIYII